jgi:hypothetical protein
MTSLHRLLCRALGALVSACAAVASGAAVATTGDAAAEFHAVAARGCAAIEARVAAVSREGPVLLRSYEGTSTQPLEPALTSAAFVYDNALAIMALLSCDRVAPARRIGAAFVAALDSTSGAAPRLRNVYRAGVVQRLPLPNGWWDAASQRWVEDAYQLGTATGNVAWVALSLLALDARDTGDARWRGTAERLATWAIDNARDTRGDGGYSGGVHGFDASPQRLGWKSTEHNIDLVALFDQLVTLKDETRWRVARDHARRFVDAQWDARTGHFVTGTLPDGITPNRDTSGLDAQLWPLLLRDAPQEWRRALAFAEREHGVDGGFDFNADRDGLWVEGTAQGALVYRVVGRIADARTMLASVAREVSAGGLLQATREPRITTGLAVGPDSTSADFHYFRRPHLGATAWGVLAATGANPFTMNAPSSTRTKASP